MTNHYNSYQGLSFFIRQINANMSDFFMKFKPTAYQGDSTLLAEFYSFEGNSSLIPCSLEVLYLGRETGRYSCYHEVSTG